MSVNSTPALAKAIEIKRKLWKYAENEPDKKRKEELEEILDEFDDITIMLDPQRKGK